MPLIDRQVAGREVPLAAILGITEHRLATAGARCDRTIGYRFALDVPPRPRDRVVAAEVEARAGAILRLQAQTGVLSIQEPLGVVLEQRQIVGAASHARRCE